MRKAIEVIKAVMFVVVDPVKASEKINKEVI